MLVSPGLEITVSDESQYVSTAVGTVPFVLMATAQDKLFNGSVATYTTKDYAGKLVAVTSQRDLITNFGYPKFFQSSAGTPIHGHELNEYGLMTAYSALGVVNRMFIIRADIDLAQLEGTSNRPIGMPADGMHWLDLTASTWGIYEWNDVKQEFANKVPLILTTTNNITVIGGMPTPKSSVGSIGAYAIIANDVNNYLFYKGMDNNWAQVGSDAWQHAFPTVQGTIAGPVLTAGDMLSINGVQVTLIGSTVALAASSINSAFAVAAAGVGLADESELGVTAGVLNNRLVLTVSNKARSAGPNASPDGVVKITDVLNTPSLDMGLMQTDFITGNFLLTSTYASPAIEFGGYVRVPDWRITDVDAVTQARGRPSGSVWVKTSVLGGGASLQFRKFDGENQSWTPIPAPIYGTESEAIGGLDPFGGGLNIEYGSIIILRDVLDNGTVTFRPAYRSTAGVTKITGHAPTLDPVFTPGHSFLLRSSRIAETNNASLVNETVITLSPDTLTGAATVHTFVADILAKGIEFVTATVENNNAISFIHKQGGTIELLTLSGTALTTAGFDRYVPGIMFNPLTNVLTLSNFSWLDYTYAFAAPYTAPVDGTMWYYDTPLEVDIMVNDTTGWKGYRNVSLDARGFNLTRTDPAGPIMSPTQPTTKSNNMALTPGDLWIDTGDLEHFPVIRRYGRDSKWTLLDNTDVISQNGIVFADARWDATVNPSTLAHIGGLLDPASGEMPDITEMATSNYIDLDCPDHRLYPRGTLLFNTRRSGFNVKHYVNDYFNEHAYPDAAFDGLLPEKKASWVTSSGLHAEGPTAGAPYTGHHAQRVMVVKAMRAALDANDIVREESFQFNLIVAPGYQELITNMVMLNNDRKNTAFIIGDTPMDMPAKIMDFTAWSNNTNGDGLSTADPYLGVYYPHALTNDLQGNTIVMPASHMILRAAIKSDQVSYPWFAYAGTRRGNIDNATDIGFVDRRRGSFVRNGINQGLRDALYQLNINPLTILPGVGLVNFGNKTRNGFTSAMDRVNVARLINYIRTILAHVGDGFLFEPNDAITRNQIKYVISSAINDLIAKRGVYDYLVICDETNNTNDRIDRNELYVDIAIEPMKAVEFIYIPIRLKHTGGIKNSGR